MPLNQKNLNILLSFILLIITTMVVIKFFKSSSVEKIDLSAPQPDTEVQLQNDPTPQFSQEQIKQRYEEIKVERLITAMKSHHSRDVQLIVADGINFDLVSKDEYDLVRQVAQEENFLHVIRPLLKD